MLLTIAMFIVVAALTTMFLAHMSLLCSEDCETKDWQLMVARARHIDASEAKLSDAACSEIE